MSLVEPGMCRSADCDKQADYYAEVQSRYSLRPTDPRRKRKPKAKEAWSGEFCSNHLSRCLADVADMMTWHEVLVIERIVWT